MNRPSIQDTMISIAYSMAQRSTCSRRHNGAVIATYEGVVLSTGYNGSLSGMPHCNHECSCNGRVDQSSMVQERFHNLRCNSRRISNEGGCPIAVHAEANAIYFAARQGVATANSLIYCTTEPCQKCAEAIVQSGITECWYAEEYRLHDGIDLLHQAGVAVHHYSSTSIVKEPAL